MGVLYCNSYEVNCQDVSRVNIWDAVPKKTERAKGQANTIQISQNIENKALFDILLGGRIRMNIISQEREKLELTLLAMNEIEVDESDLRE